MRLTHTNEADSQDKEGLLPQPEGRNFSMQPHPRMLHLSRLSFALSLTLSHSFNPNDCQAHMAYGNLPHLSLSATAFPCPMPSEALDPPERNRDGELRH